MGFSVELLGALGFAFYRQDPGARWLHTSPRGLGLSTGHPSIAAGLAVLLQSPPHQPLRKQERPEPPSTERQQQNPLPHGGTSQRVNSTKGDNLKTARDIGSQVKAGNLGWQVKALLTRRH